MRKPKLIKRQKARNAEYYDMQRTQDDLYKRSLENQNFIKLMDIIQSDENIMLAYRNIKRNGGSLTPGTDGRTIEDLETLSTEELIDYVRRRLRWYVPQPVKRVEIPKGNGKTRPLGIPTIADRLVQQCFLQVLEPICEAKFHDRSYGFRPLRSAQNAMAVYYKYIQLMDLYYVVDVDIKGFFDNINHGKLLRQMWSIGIRDKKVISIISAMLKAEVAGIGFPEKGTPQGGIISPLLANIVLNELDWWISDQWQTFELRKQYSVQVQRNGTAQQGFRLRAMRDYTNLKEGWIVRYADDFKIVCRTRRDAERWFHAVRLWLKEQLGLDISPEKSKIVNLRKHYSEFLGLKVKAVRKGNKPKCKEPTPRYVVQSHICDKALKRISETANERIHDIIEAGNGNTLMRAVGRYNAFVMGMHNYYQMATHVVCDVNSIDYHVFRTFEKRTHTFFEAAVTDEIIDYSPMQRMKKPKPKKDEIKTDSKALTLEQSKRLIECLNAEPLMWRALVMLLLDSGCRRGEAVALRWENVNLKSGYTEIKGNAQYTVEKGKYITTPKSGKGRLVILNQPILDLLKEWKREQTKWLFSMGLPHTGFIFTQDDGEMLNPNAPTKYLSKFGKRYNFPGLHPHTLRHTMATVSIANGADVVSVSKKLGHAAPSITLNIYSHANQEAQLRANKTLEMALYKKA